MQVNYQYVQIHFAYMQLGDCMDWSSLKVFLAIADAGSLSGASKALGVNHSTVFRRLQALELELGVKLLEKIENKYILTTMGEEVLREGKIISESFNLIDRRIAGGELQPKGSVRITAPYNIVNRYLPKMLKDFAKEYPDITIDLLSSNLGLNLNNRQADIAIRATSAPAEHLVGRQLCQIPWGVYGSLSYIEAHGRPETLSDLEHHRLIGGSGAMLNLPGFDWIKTQYANAITMTCDELTAMSYFAEHGHGLAFLPDDQSRDEIIKLFDYLPGKTSDLWLLTHPDLRKVARIRLVMNCLAEHFAHIF